MQDNIKSNPLRDFFILLLLMLSGLCLDAQDNYPHTSPLIVESDIFEDYEYILNLDDQLFLYSIDSMIDPFYHQISLHDNYIELYLGEDIAYITTEVDTVTGITQYMLYYESIGHFMTSTSLSRIVSTASRLSTVNPYTAWESSGIDNQQHQLRFMRGLYLLQVEDYFSIK